MHEKTLLILKTLAHPTRVEIVKLIKNNDGNFCYNDIFDKLSLSLTTINFHLKKLENAKILVTHKNNGKILLSVNSLQIENAKKDFLEF